MTESILQGLLNLVHWDVALFMLLGVFIGNAIGILPWLKDEKDG